MDLAQFFTIYSLRYLDLYPLYIFLPAMRTPGPLFNLMHYINKLSGQRCLTFVGHWRDKQISLHGPKSYIF